MIEIKKRETMVDKKKVTTKIDKANSEEMITNMATEKIQMKNLKEKETTKSKATMKINREGIIEKDKIEIEAKIKKNMSVKIDSQEEKITDNKNNKIRRNRMFKDKAFRSTI